MKTISLIPTTSRIVRLKSRWYFGGSPWSKRSWKATHQEKATIAPSTRSCQSRCGESSWRIRSARFGAGKAGACAPRRLRRAYAGAGDGGSDAADDALRRLGGDPGPERQREVLCPRLLGRRQRAGLVAEEVHGRLQVERRRVVRRRRDSRLAQRRADRVALARPADEEVVDVARLIQRNLHELAEAQLGVPGRRSAPRLVPACELRQEDAQERGLQLVEARVVSDELEVGLVLGAVEGEELDALRKLVVVRRHEPTVAEAEEVLRRVEAEGRDRAVLRDFRGAESLRGVLEDGNAELDQGPHVHHPSEQVHGDDRPRPFGH